MATPTAPTSDSRPEPRSRLDALGLPAWANELITQYESNATSQFILYGNVNDRFLLPALPQAGVRVMTGSGAGGAGGDASAGLGTLMDFLVKVLMPRFEVVLTYDLGNGLRVERGNEVFSQWPRLKESPNLPRAPREAIETATHYLRYCVNLARLGRTGARPPQVGIIIRSADLVLPAGLGNASYELSALASLIRDWAADPAYADALVANFLISDNLNDLHPLVAGNPRALAVKIPLPVADDMRRALTFLAPTYPKALAQVPVEQAAPLLAGATLVSVEGMLRTREHTGRALAGDDLLGIKKALVEKECAGLIDFIDPNAGGKKRSLDDVQGQEALKRWLRQDLALWRAGDTEALPMGYLLCGPVGTGKTYMVECLAGEAGVPVVKLKNFRDKWVGSTEGNLEKIFRLVQALGRAFVFIDEADQALGKRDGGANDGGIGGRIYAMMAEEMSNTRNRGKVIWILASSRPDLIEVDLKRPGRVDVKIPLFPTASPEEGWGLLAALCKRRGLVLGEGAFAALKDLVPDLLTPGAAEALAVKAYRASRTSGARNEAGSTTTPDPIAALRSCLTGYQHPVARAVMDFQIGLAVAEASDVAFVPERFRAP